MLKKAVLYYIKQLFHERTLDMTSVSDSADEMRSTESATISSYYKREWNNCFIKYQTLDKNISNFSFYRLEFSAILREKFP